MTFKIIVKINLKKKEKNNNFYDEIPFSFTQNLEATE